jgi:hypothetical protein
VLDAQEVEANGDVVIFSQKRMARIARGGKTVWEVADESRQMGWAKADVIASDTALLLARYDAMDSSDVELWSLDPKTGHVRWKALATGTHASHYGYSHFVYLEIRGEELILVDQEAAGWFIEKRRISNGELIARFGKGPDQD